MIRDPRNKLLLARLAETNPFKKELAPRIFAIGAAYDRDVEAIAQDRDRSAEGKRNKTAARRAEALLDLDNALKPVADHRKESERLSAGKKVPSYDKTDIVAALNRRELRDRSVNMTFGQRTMRMTDKAFRDAVCEMPAWVSGFNESEPNELELYKEGKREQDREINGPLMDALEARASTEAEIQMAADVVKNDIQGDGAYQAEIQTARDRFVAAATA